MVLSAEREAEAILPGRRRLGLRYASSTAGAESKRTALLDFGLEALCQQVANGVEFVFFVPR